MNRNRMPNLFVLGASKAGSTSLYYYLRQHRDIFMSVKKETYFFNADSLYEKGIEWYLSTHFRKASSFPVRGEATTNYLALAGKVAPRLALAYPNDHPRFIAIFRDPVERAHSQYWHEVNKLLTEKWSLEEALLHEEERVKDADLLAEGKINYRYFRNGLYSQQVETYLQYFDKSHFLFLLFEDLRSDPRAVCRAMFQFLGVDDSFPVDVSTRYNVAGRPRSRTFEAFLNEKRSIKVLSRPLMRALQRLLPYEIKDYLMTKNTVSWRYPALSRETESSLRLRYRDEVMRLQTLIGRDLSDWMPGKHLSDKRHRRTQQIPG
ncbi:sulfotransferase domain-containing protein [bacterium]|nr:sulfotransferase domain-containing protein [bacterium]